MQPNVGPAAAVPLPAGLTAGGSQAGALPVGDAGGAAYSISGSGFLSCVYILSICLHVCNEVELVLCQTALSKRVLMFVQVARL